ncbi:MAG: MarR family transcriptional regulator [Patescibacteria group bacterium]
MKNTPLTIAESVVLTGVRLKTIANRFVFSPMGLTGAKFRVLRMVQKGKQKPSEIMKFAGGTKSNMSQRLNTLEKEGLIKRSHSNAGDRRNIFVVVTPQGEELLKKVLVHFQHSSAELKNHFTEQEVKSHFAFIDKLNRLIDEHEKEIPKMFDSDQ